MELRMSTNQQRYKMKAAVAMYDAGFSMLSIQNELGSDITARSIKDWSIHREANKNKQVKRKIKRRICERPNCQKEAVKEFIGVMLCSRCYKTQKKKALHSQREKNKTKKKHRDKNPITEASWKKRVFASWKDTPEQKAIRRSPEYQEWRRIVLERDNYTCHHCEQTGGRLVVHHIKTFKMHEELRMEPDNGIVLCNSCHEKLHLGRMKKPKILRITA